MDRKLFATKMIVGALGLSGISCGHGSFENLEYSRESLAGLTVPHSTPVFIAGVDGWCSGNMKKLGLRLQQESGARIVVQPVHYWQRNMPHIRRAHRDGHKIILLGYSAGCHQSVLTARQCLKEGITVETMIMVDPIYTNFGPIDIPSNVRRKIVYFSSDKIDPMFWARGDIKKWQEVSKKDDTFDPPRRLHGWHYSCFLWENVGAVLMKHIAETDTQEKDDVPHRRIRAGIQFAWQAANESATGSD